MPDFLAGLCVGIFLTLIVTAVMLAIADYAYNQGRMG